MLRVDTPSDKYTGFRTDPYFLISAILQKHSSKTYNTKTVEAARQNLYGSKMKKDNVVDKGFRIRVCGRPIFYYEYSGTKFFLIGVKKLLGGRLKNI